MSAFTLLIHTFDKLSACVPVVKFCHNCVMTLRTAVSSVHKELFIMMSIAMSRFDI